MHPFFADWRWRLLHLVAWTLLGAVLAALVRLLYGTPWIGSLIFGLPAGWFGGIVALSAGYASKTTPATWGDRIRPAVSWLVSAALGGLLWAFGSQLWWQMLDRSGLVDLPEAQRDSLYAVLRVLGVLGYLLAIAAYRMMQAFDDATEARRLALQSDVAQREAELKALRAQLDPHFLFNSLNSIAGLTGTNPAKAREMCQLLADFLRQSLTIDATARIPLAREVGLVEQYLRVEQVRFGARLAVSLDIAADTADVLVPSLLLQPLVENAVRHGIATMLEGGTVAIATRRAGERVVISVANPRDPDARRRGTGMGLDIVRRRLAATFGDHAMLTVEPGPETFRAQITIPIQEAA